MSLAKISNGTLLKVGDGILVSGLEGYTTVPEVMKLSGPSTKFDLLDVTSHDSSGFFREYIPGLLDGDSIKFTVNWRPSNAVHKALRLAAVAQTNRNFKMVFPDSTDNTVICSTYIQKFPDPKADIGTALVSDGDLKVTGNPLWS